MDGARGCGGWSPWQELHGLDRAPRELRRAGRVSWGKVRVRGRRGLPCGRTSLTAAGNHQSLSGKKQQELIPQERDPLPCSSAPSAVKPDLPDSCGPTAVGMHPARCSAPCPLRTAGNTAPCPRILGRASPPLTPGVIFPGDALCRSASLAWRTGRPVHLEKD